MAVEIVLQVPDEDWDVWRKAWLDHPDIARRYTDPNGKHLPLDEYAPLDIVATLNLLVADNLRNRVAIGQRTAQEVWAIHQAIEQYHNRKAAAEVINDATD